MNTIKVSIVGSTGYVGAELVHGFSGHPQVEFKYLTSETFKGKKFSDIYPVYRGLVDKILVSTEEVSYETIGRESDLVITALPHGVSSKVVPQLIEAGCRVIDHSGDFRYKDIDTYTKSYKLDHPHPELLKDAVYGLPMFSILLLMNRVAVVPIPSFFTLGALVMMVLSMLCPMMETLL